MRSKQNHYTGFKQRNFIPFLKHAVGSIMVFNSFCCIWWELLVMNDETVNFEAIHPSIHPSAASFNPNPGYRNLHTAIGGQHSVHCWAKGFAPFIIRILNLWRRIKGRFFAEFQENVSKEWTENKVDDLQKPSPDLNPITVCWRTWSQQFMRVNPPAPKRRSCSVQKK